MRQARSFASVLTIASATMLLTQTLAQPPAQRSPDDPGPPPMGAPVLPDTAVASRDSLMRDVLRKIAGRESAPAESVFKNIKVLKGMPAGRVPRVMNQGFGKSLGVGCAHCHVVGEWEKDDRPEKQIAREMWTMMTTLNAETLPKIANLRGKPAAANCTTCHRGAARPALSMP